MTTLKQATPVHTFLAMLARDVRVLRREMFTFLSRTLMQPLFFVFVFAYVMPRIGGGDGFGRVAGVSFATVLVPGMLSTTMFISGLMAVTVPLMMELSYNNEIEDRLLAPAPVWLLGLAKISSGAVQALIGALVVFPVVYFVHESAQPPQIDLTDWPLLTVVLVVSSVLSAGLGLLMGTMLDIRKSNVLFSLVTVPLTMLGCVYYPWAALQSTQWLQIAVLVNPLVYSSEGLRTALTPAMPHMPTWSFLLVLLGGTTGVVWLALQSFARKVRR
ncbi:ABC transporter permease [Actinokineospora enzanensis]|uniref:ABC transporter permease n=1 Tax=Actinokineospora enzanensis TaxID=155975 RepID=UPI0003693B17|nr:ABC transporter permease [Actinokineospora enzanensis]